MTLAAPVALWLLAAIPIVLFLHVRRRRTIDLGSTYLWRRVDLSGLVPPRRRPQLANVALLLQLLAIVAVAVALAGPTVGTIVTGEHRIVVLDVGAYATRAFGDDDRPAAVDAALETLERSLGGAPVTVVTAEPQPRVEVVRSVDTGVLAGLRARVGVADGPPDWTAVARILDVVRDPDERTVVDLVVALEHAITWRGPVVDRVAADVVRVHAIGDAPVAPGLVDVRVDLVDGETRVEVEAALSAAADVELWFAATAGVPVLVDRGPVELLPNGNGRRRVTTEMLGAGILTATLVADEAPVLTDSLHLVLRAPRPARVLYVGPGNDDLIAAFVATRAASVDVATGLPDDVSAYALVVVDRALVERHPRVPTLWLGVIPPIGSPGSDWIDDEGIDRGGWSVSHPLVDGVDLGAITVFRAREFPVLDGAIVLFDGADRPLIQTRDTRFGRETVLAFSTVDSDWPRLASFPVFVENLLKLVAPGAGQLSDPTCRVGAGCHLGAALVYAGVEIQSPDGTLVSPVPAVFARDRADTAFAVHAAFEGTFVPRRAGIHRVVGETGARSIAVHPALGLDTALTIVATHDVDAQAVDIPTPPRALTRWLLALATLVVVAEAVLAWRRDRREHGVASSVTRRRRGVSIALRGLVVALLALAWFDGPVPRLERTASIVVIVDASDRYVGNVRALLDAIARDGAPPGWQREAVVAVLRSDGRRLDGGGAAPPSHPVDLERALQHAAALLGDDGGRIVLVGDGHETVGNAARTAPALVLRGVVVEAVVVGGLPLDEVWVDRIDVPTRVYTGSSFDLVGLIGSESPREASVVLIRDGERLDAYEVRLAAGINRVAVPLVESEPGRHRYELAVEVDEDVVRGNERAGVVIDVVEPLLVAVVSPDGDVAGRLVRALAAQGIDAEHLLPSEAPSAVVATANPLAWWEETTGWSDYVAVVLAGVPAVDLGWEQQRSLVAFVSELGGGLIVVGGERTFGPGGYYLSGIEDVLPVEVEIPHERPIVALTFVLDRSGSMQAMVGDTGLNRLDVTKVATVGAIDMLDEDSLVSIVVFDGVATELLGWHPAGDLETVIAVLDPVQPGGGTNIFAGLEMGVARQRELDDSWTRHIILMTDGLGQGGIDYDPILDEILEAGITVSTAAIGQGADVWLLEEIAARGGGAAYATEDFEAFPSIMAQEILLLAADPIVRDPVVPRWDERDAAFVRGVQPPRLGGFVTTSRRAGAQTHWVGPDDEPILASWRYGLGRVVALTSDGAGDWSSEWLDAVSFPAFWSQAVRWASVDVPGPGLDVDVGVIGDEVLVRATLLGDEGGDVVRAELVATLLRLDGVDGVTVVDERRLDERTPGRSAGTLTAAGPGLYEVEVRTPVARLVTARSVESIVDPITRPVYLPYEGRLRQETWTADLLAGLAVATGGGLVDIADVVAVADRHLIWTAAGVFWGVVAVLAFLVDLAHRYGVLAALLRALPGPTSTV